MASNSQPPASDTSSPNYPKKYWWVILIAVPLAIALLQYQPWKHAGGAAGGFSVSGNQFLGPAIVGNISMVINEAAKAGATLDPALIEQLKAAAAQSKAGDHNAAVVTIEQVRATSPTLAKLPSLSNSLGIELLSAGKPRLARKAFADVLKADPDNKAAWAGLAQLGDAPISPLKIVNSSSASNSTIASFIVDESDSSVWRSGNNVFPHTFILELPVDAIVSEMSFNNAGEGNAAAKDIEISLSTTSPTSDFKIAAKGVLAAGEIGQPIKLNPPRVGRWIKLRILSNYGNNSYTGLGDVTVTGKPYVT
jgi:hypothetical protein